MTVLKSTRPLGCELRIGLVVLRGFKFESGVDGLSRGRPQTMRLSIGCVASSIFRALETLSS